MTHPSDEHSGEGAPSENELASLLAPFWSAGKVAAELGFEAHQLAQAAAESELLALETSDGGALLFPVAQFERVDGSVRVRPEISAMLRELVGVDRWSAGELLCMPADELNHLSPYEAAAAGVDVETLTQFARLVSIDWR
jgi:hypothetical protein